MNLVVFVLIAGVVLGAVGLAGAHPPDAVGISFDVEAHVLTVTVDHGTRDAAKHFVDRIEVELNGEKVIEQKFSSQMDDGAQKAIYMIFNAEVGDEIKATAACNIAGKKKASFKIEKPPEPEEADKQN